MRYLISRTACKGQSLIIDVQEVVPIVYSYLLYNMGQYFLDTQYNRNSLNGNITASKCPSSRIDTVCPRRRDPFYIVYKLLYEMGQYFLDIL